MVVPGLIFAGIGFVCGMRLRVVGLLIVVVCALLGYTIVLAQSGVAFGDVMKQLVVCFIASQVGYALIVAIRAALLSQRK
ncbi:hypothetical protein GJW-30_1_04048 [Variibacter gotjawalensis]|uniref:Uncharacterized protein n=1 Tax=Variibacter gotjawalensis TaxID=1333996 RepID=A0A0S3Q014_9BRAD|nr:hypothetical protein [Variibacter gotjawalensis]NIK47331.1 hypothetical protein [Variibacter gotjawalensis]RZS49229.1 hypothetical protein EV661_1655 [Variibacter gotjawalensis]BAT61491.1 hypothetical protein GJW-30_1_04048 [Variibacter gotjawalensis]